MRAHRTTGLTDDQFEELMRRVEQRMVWHRPSGRPRKLTLRQAVKCVLMYFRNNLTEEVIAELVFVDQAAISRAIRDLEGVIADVLEEFIPDHDLTCTGDVSLHVLPGCLRWPGR